MAPHSKKVEPSRNKALPASPLLFKCEGIPVSE